MFGAFGKDLIFSSSETNSKVVGKSVERDFLPLCVFVSNRHSERTHLFFNEHIFSSNSAILCFLTPTLFFWSFFSSAFKTPRTNVTPQHPKTQATGVEVDDEVSASFQKFKLGQAPYKLRYFVYKIENKKKIVIDTSGDLTKTYDDFVADMPENDCRYGLIDVSFETDDGRPTSKLVFISWNPDNASVRPKMLYSGSKEAIKSALVGVGIHINATDHSELDFETSILPVCKKFT